MGSIKLQRFWHCIYRNSDDFQASVPCPFTLCAVHAYRHVSPVWSKRIQSLWRVLVRIVLCCVHLLVYLIDC